MAITSLTFLLILFVVKNNDLRAQKQKQRRLAELVSEAGFFIKLTKNNKIILAIQAPLLADAA